MSDFQAGFILAQTLEKMQQQLDAHENVLKHLLEQSKEKENDGTTNRISTTRP